MMANFMLRTAALLCLCYSATGLLFDAHPSTIEIGLSTRFDVVCSFNHEMDYDFSSLVSLIISRARDSAKVVFIELASIDAFSGHVSDRVQGNATITGAINNLGVSYLRLEWKFPDDEVSGLYKCVAHGIDETGHPISVMSTSPVISEIPNTRELVQVVRNVLLNMDYALENICISGCWQSRLDQMMKARFEISPVYNGHRYLLSKVANLASAAVAQESCELYGGYLAEIDDDYELIFVQNFTKSPPGIDYTMVLIGGTDFGHKSHWVFDRTGRNVTYTKWVAGRPTTTATNNCMYLSGPTWTMYDYICFEVTRNYNTRYICELPEQ